MSTWRLIETYGVPAAEAMGLDEALLRSVGSPPTLRLYTWAPAALSLGYFQAVEDVPAAAHHDTVVRRSTGGGAIHHHAGELTFSLTLPLDHPAYRGPVAGSYARAHGAVAAALDAVGVQGVAARGDRGVGSDLPDTGMCFHASTPEDLCWRSAPAGQGPALGKGVGTAQRRTGGRILHHGSIKLLSDPLEPSVATIAEAGGDPDPGRLGRALVQSFGQAFAVRFDAAAPTREESALAAELGPHFGSAEFVNRSVRRARKRGR